MIVWSVIINDAIDNDWFFKPDSLLLRFRRLSRLPVNSVKMIIKNEKLSG